MHYPDTESPHMLPYHMFVLYGVPALRKCFTEKTAVNADRGQIKENSNFYHFSEKNHKKDYASCHQCAKWGKKRARIWT